MGDEGTRLGLTTNLRPIRFAIPRTTLPHHRKQRSLHVIASWPPARGRPTPNETVGSPGEKALPLPLCPLVGGGGLCFLRVGHRPAADPPLMKQ
jgi:hypothetical protein